MTAKKTKTSPMGDQTPIPGRTANIRQWSANAKINLYLHINGRREKGYHCLDSLIVFADFGDKICVKQNNHLSLKIHGPFCSNLPSNDNNLVLKAANLLAQAAGIKAHAEITLQKNLPIEAGLGGGSADAAATLLALRDLWKVQIDNSGLSLLAQKLGADVPVCLSSPRSSIVSGIGHIVEKGPSLERFALLLVNPGVSLSTATVFKNFKYVHLPNHPWRFDKVNIKKITVELAHRRNDLEPAALQLNPVIGKVLKMLIALPNCRLARMSGSGATCFGLFDSLNQAQKAASLLRTANTDWWIKTSVIKG